jgi:hypothetical protein
MQITEIVTFYVVFYRSHDLCPRKVLAFRAAYGLVNWSFYTKSVLESMQILSIRYLFISVVFLIFADPTVNVMQNCMIV